MNDFFSNIILLTAASAWFAAQLIKVGLYYWQNKEVGVITLLFGTGGMPSSHSATVTALATVTLFKCGAASPEFAITLILAIIVMRDASGVRLETGKQAELLNMILMQDFWVLKEGETLPDKFKESIGHTPTQVLCGGVLGFIIGLIAGLNFT